MADPNQNQNGNNNGNNGQKGGGNQNQKGGGATGVTVGMSVSPNDLTPRTLSGMFTIGLVGAGAILALRWLHPVLSRTVMGVSEKEMNAAPALNADNPNDVINALKGLPSGAKKGGILCAFNTLDDDTKKSVLEILNK